MQDEPLVTIWVSDPWEFPDENEGRVGFVAHVVGIVNGTWLLRLTRPVKYEGATWNFAIPTARFVGKRFFDDHGEFGTPANIHFVTDAQATSQAFLDAYDSRKTQATPWVIGSLQRGISTLIPNGANLYVEPTWKPKKR